jgi:hypothetical protein
MSLPLPVVVVVVIAWWWWLCGGRPVTGPSRRHMTFGRGVCRRQTGTAEFKLAGRSECTATSLKGEANPKQNHVPLLNNRARSVVGMKAKGTTLN